MSRPLRIQYPDAYYHVTCRGNEQRAIFRNPEDQKVFFRLLARSVNIFEDVNWGQIFTLDNSA